MIVIANLIPQQLLMYAGLINLNKGVFMNKLFLLTLIFTSFSYSDLDIGDDFEPGDLVTAEEFNLKFGKLKKVVGEIKDSDIIGVWDCTSYKESINYVDYSYEIANGGNGQVGNGYFYSNSGTITFSESDEESSLNSPKQFTISRSDVLNDNGDDEGFYTLLLNKLYFFTSSNGNISLSNSFHIEFIQENKISFEPTKYSGNYPNPNVVCEKVS